MLTNYLIFFQMYDHFSLFFIFIMHACAKVHLNFSPDKISKISEEKLKLKLLFWIKVSLNFPEITSYTGMFIEIVYETLHCGTTRLTQEIFFIIIENFKLEGNFRKLINNRPACKFFLNQISNLKRTLTNWSTTDCCFQTTVSIK